MFTKRYGDNYHLKIIYSIEFAEFWAVIEERMNLNPTDIIILKQILTLLGFNSMLSISRLNSQSDIDKVELEFIKLKETEGFRQKYPDLYEKAFGYGTKLTLSLIVNEIKKGKFAESIDFNQSTQHVLDQCKVVSERKSLTNFISRA